VSIDLTTLSPAEEAVATTLRGWGAELDTDEKFWWADWMSMIRDVVTTMRTGEPVLYDDDGDRSTRSIIPDEVDRCQPLDCDRWRSEIQPSQEI